ncbi:Redoxin [Popillia japonica]|uniref:Peroxiredoxin-5 n=1 Tax=Popillia japonica TaxID=7064 RepID=A0AAW1LVZ2_POPJA
MNVNRLVQRVVCSSRLFTFPKYLSTTAVTNMPLKEGDSLPNVDLFEETPANKVNIAQLSQGKKIVIFAVPGAFTPGCSKTHLPGYVKKADDLKKQGVSEIVCVSVNDPFVMAAWGKDQRVDDTDLAVLGGLRSKRYSMVVENGKVLSLQVEPDGTGLSCSLADAIKLQ